MQTHQGEGEQAQLRAALNRYLVARGRRGDAHDSEAVAARLALVHLLQDAGWEPPAALRASLEADARALRGPDRRTA